MKTKVPALLILSVISSAAFAVTENDLKTVCQRAVSSQFEGKYSDRYGNTEDRKISQFGQASAYNPGTFPKYGNNFVVITTFVVDRIANGRVINRDIKTMDCVVSPNLKVLGLEYNR